MGHLTLRRREFVLGSSFSLPLIGLPRTSNSASSIPIINCTAAPKIRTPNIGRGFNGLANEWAARAIEVDGNKENCTPRVDDDEYKSSISRNFVSETQYDVQKSLRTSATEKFAALAIRSEGSFSLQVNRDVSEGYFFLISEFFIPTRRMFLTPTPRLNLEAQAVQEDQKYFFEKYGNLFCSEIIWGGRLLVVCKLKSKTERGILNIKSNAEAAFPAARTIAGGLDSGGSIAADYAKNVDKLGSEVEFEAYSIGVSSASGVVTGRDNVLKTIEQFPNLVLSSNTGGGEIEYKFSNYIQADSEKKIRPYDVAPINDKLDELRLLKRNAELKNLSLVRYARFQSEYEAYGSDIEDEMKKTSAILYDIDQTIGRISANPLRSITVPDFLVLLSGLPEPKKKRVVGIPLVIECRDLAGNEINPLPRADTQFCERDAAVRRFFGAIRIRIPNLTDDVFVQARVYENNVRTWAANYLGWKSEGKRSDWIDTRKYEGWSYPSSELTLRLAGKDSYKYELQYGVTFDGLDRELPGVNESRVFYVDHERDGTCSDDFTIRAIRVSLTKKA